MSNENNRESVSDAEFIETFKENDKTLIGLVTRIRDIYAKTIMIEKQIKIDALRRAILEEDIRCQLKKISMINDVLSDIEK